MRLSKMLSSMINTQLVLTEGLLLLNILAVKIYIHITLISYFPVIRFHGNWLISQTRSRRWRQEVSKLRGYLRLCRQHAFCHNYSTQLL